MRFRRTPFDEVWQHVVAHRAVSTAERQKTPAVFCRLAEIEDGPGRVCFAAYSRVAAESEQGRFPGLACVGFMPVQG